MSFYYGDENSTEVNLAKQVFGTFAGSSNGLNNEQFRKMFYATGEDLQDNDIKELFAEVDDDRDGTISLEEFIRWFKKDDSYEYNIRTKPLRDVKDRLKTPAFFRAVQYLMQRNSGSGLDSNGKILDINLKLKVGNTDQHAPVWGFDIRHETYPNDSAHPVLIGEFIWDESREIIDAENNMRKIAQNYIDNHHTNAVFEPMQVDGKPGGRITVDLPAEAAAPLQMITSFMSNLEDFHFWAHLSQGLDELNGADLCMDAGLIFKGNRTFFNMLPLEAAASIGVNRQFYTLAQLMDHVHLNVAVDKLADLGANLLPPQAVIQKMKKDMSLSINYGSFSTDFHQFFPMGVKTLKTLTMKAYGHSVVATGINMDVSFIYNQAFSQAELDAHFNRYNTPPVYDYNSEVVHRQMENFEDDFAM